VNNYDTNIELKKPKRSYRLVNAMLMSMFVVINKVIVSDYTNLLYAIRGFDY